MTAKKVSFLVPSRVGLHTSLRNNAQNILQQHLVIFIQPGLAGTGYAHKKRTFYSDKRKKKAYPDIGRPLYLILLQGGND